MKVWQFYRLVSYSFYTSYNLQKLQTFRHKYLHITNYSIPKKNYWDKDYNFKLHNRPCVLWRQELNTSDLVFRLLLGLSYIIWCFSLRHNRHFLVDILNGGVFSMMDHSTSYPFICPSGLKSDCSNWIWSCSLGFQSHSVVPSTLFWKACWIGQYRFQLYPHWKG